MSKVVNLDDLADHVPDGAHLGLTGFAVTRNAVAAAKQIVAAGRRDLTVTQVIGGPETDLLVAGGCVRRLVYSGGSMDRFGPLHSINAAISAGDLQVQEYSSLALTLRLHAAALGLPYVATRSMLASQLLERLLGTGDVIVGEDPWTGLPVAILAPLRPDVTIVHADVADSDGNAAIAGPLWAIRETAFAARAVVVTCEELVAPGSIDPDRVVLPAAVVSAVAAAPGGAAPTAVYSRYDYDRASLEGYARAAKAGQAVSHLLPGTALGAPT